MNALVNITSLPEPPVKAATTTGIPPLPPLGQAKITGIAIHVCCEHAHWQGGTVNTCVVREMNAGREIEVLPCAGMNLNPGDVVEVTVTKIKDRGQ